MSIRVEDLRPEDDPRYLAPVKPFIPKADTPEELESALAYHGAMLSMFSTPGWKELQNILKNRRDHAIKALTSINGETEVFGIYALRQRLALVEELLGFEETSKKASALAQERLSKLRTREES